MEERTGTVEKVDNLSKTPKWWRNESGIHVEVEFENAIYVDVEFNLSDEELKGLYQRLEDQRAARIQRTLFLYYAHRKTLREISTELKISKSQVFKDLQTFKKEAKMRYKHELARDNSPITLMLDLEAQTNARIRILWEKYEHLEQFLGLLSPTLKRTQQRLLGNPQSPVRKSNSLSQESRECRALIETQKNLLVQIRNETQQLLNIYDGFGLSFPVADASNVWKDIDVKIEELLIVINEIFEVLNSEIPDKSILQRLGGKMGDKMLSGHLRNILLSKFDKTDENSIQDR